MKVSETDSGPKNEAQGEAALNLDKAKNSRIIAAKDAKISALQAHNELLVERVAELRNLEGVSYDLKKQLDVKSAENDILRQATISLQQRVLELEGGTLQMATASAQPAASPSAGSFPDVSTTGVPADIPLKPSGALVISQPGVYEGLAIDGDVWIKASDVTLRHLHIKSSNFQGINCDDEVKNLKVHYCTIDGLAKTAGSYGIMAPVGCEIIGNDISGFENGIMAGSDNVIRGNYIHDLLVEGADPHYDGIALHGGQKNVLIEGNTVISWDTGGVFIKADFGDIDDIRVLGNLIKCQPGHKYSAAVYVYGLPNGVATNVIVHGNHCEVGAYRYYFSIEGNTDGLSIKDNVDYLTLAPIP